MEGACLRSSFFVVGRLDATQHFVVETPLVSKLLPVTSHRVFLSLSRLGARLRTRADLARLVALPC